MRYRNVFVLGALVLFAGAAGPVTCSQMYHDDLAAARAVIVKLGSGAVVVASEFQTALDGLCAQREKNVQAAQILRDKLAGMGGAGSNPKTAQNIRIINNGIAVTNRICSASPAATRTSTLKTYFLEAVAAANAIQDALSASQSANGT